MLPQKNNRPNKEVVLVSCELKGYTVFPRFSFRGEVSSTRVSPPFPT